MTLKENNYEKCDDNECPNCLRMDKLGEEDERKIAGKKAHKDLRNQYPDLEVRPHESMPAENLYFPPSTAFSHIYERISPFVGQSVRRSVGPFMHPSVTHVLNF